MRYSASVAVNISQPRTDVAGLEALEPLWRELHSHHLEVADHQGLVRDGDLSWSSRRSWYGRLMETGAAYLTASDERGRLLGYAMIDLVPGPDDTFEVKGGVAEVITLVVASGSRSHGVGRALLGAAEDLARDRGFDTVKIAVMRGNRRAQAFYEAGGYAVAEHVLYRRLGER